MNKHKIAWIALAVGIVVVLMLTWLVGVSPRLTHIKEADAQTAQIEESNKKTRDQIETLIFDEIDTGVSGKAAQKIGIKMKQISKDRQVICVTHLSQLAVMADNHLLIEKNTVENKTITNVIELDFNGRIKEIARIMGGENPSELILKSAEEELNKARNI